MSRPTHLAAAGHLAALDLRVAADVIAGWTDAQRDEVVTWAAAEILARGDGPANRVTRPDFLPADDGAPNTGD